MLKKALKILGSVLLLLLIILCTIPFIFKKQIDQKVKSEINAELNAHVAYSSLSFSMFTGFFHPAVSLNNFVIVGLGEFNSDTLASVQKLTLSIDLASILHGRSYKVTSLNIINPYVRLWVNKAGHANWDITKLPISFAKEEKPAPTQTHSDFSLQVDDWQIQHAHICYRNDSKGSFLELSNLSSDGNQPSNGAYNLVTRVQIDEVAYHLGETTFTAKTKVLAHVLYSFDPINNAYFFRDNFIQLNSVKVSWNGSLKRTEEGEAIDLLFYSRDQTFKNLLSLIPACADSSFDKLKADGSLVFGGSVKGIYRGIQYPAISMKLKVENGTYQKPGFTSAIKNVFIEAGITKPQGPLDSIVIQVSRLHVETGNDSANGNLIITTPESNANIQAQLSGNFELSTLGQFYSAIDAKQLSGLVSANLKFRASKKDIDKWNYKLIQATGGAVATNIFYRRKDYATPLRLLEAGFTFHPDFVSLDKLSGNMGKCNFNGTGRLNGLLPYLLGKGGLNATASLVADSVYLRDFITWYQPTETTRTSTSVSNSNGVHRQLKGLDFSNDSLTLHVAVKKVYFDKLVVEKANGTIEVSKDLITLRNVTGDLLGGDFSINSSCKNFSTEQADVTFDLGVNNLDISKAYKSVDNSETNAPSLKYLSGNFSGQIAGNGKLNADGSLNYNSLSADGKLQLPDVKIDSMPVLTEIGHLAKVKSLDHLEAKNVSSVFHYKTGKTLIEPTDIIFTNGYKISFAGITKPDHSLDADAALDVPVKEFGTLGGMAQGLLANFTKVAQSLQFKFKITGSNTRPVVKIVGMALPQN